MEDPVVARNVKAMLKENIGPLHVENKLNAL